MPYETPGEQDIERDGDRQDESRASEPHRQSDGSTNYPGGPGESGDFSTGGSPGLDAGVGAESGSGYTGEESGRDYPGDVGARSDEERPQGASFSDEERGDVADEERGGLG
jgi:hypothetical protein